MANQYWIEARWQGDLRYLCAICYLQGAMDTAQVAAQMQADARKEGHV